MESEILTGVVTIISQVGFPIAVAVYSLVRLETSMKENTKVMTQIAELLRIENRGEGK